jgi:hypothetical protein
VDVASVSAMTSAGGCCSSPQVLDLCLRAMKTVFQLDHGNRRKHNLALAVLLLEFRQQAANRPRFPFGSEQNAGIQD